LTEENRTEHERRGKSMREEREETEEESERTARGEERAG
jgi:hypothetical protein